MLFLEFHVPFGEVLRAEPSLEVLFVPVDDLELALQLVHLLQKLIVFVFSSLLLPVTHIFL